MKELQILQDGIQPTYFPFENIACNQIKYYRFNEFDEELILREEKQRKEEKADFSMC